MEGRTNFYMEKQQSVPNRYMENTFQMTLHQLCTIAHAQCAHARVHTCTHMVAVLKTLDMATRPTSQMTLMAKVESTCCQVV